MCGLIEPLDTSLISILRARDGVATEVQLRNGVSLRVWNIAWAYDDGDQWAHVASNVSPRIEGEALDFFSTSDVALVLDQATGAVLYLDVAQLLDELCVKLGFCLDPADRDRSEPGDHAPELPLCTRPHETDRAICAGSRLHAHLRSRAHGAVVRQMRGCERCDELGAVDDRPSTSLARRLR